MSLQRGQRTGVMDSKYFRPFHLGLTLPILEPIDGAGLAVCGNRATRNVTVHRFSLERETDERIRPRDTVIATLNDELRSALRKVVVG